MSSGFSNHSDDDSDFCADKSRAEAGQPAALSKLRRQLEQGDARRQYLLLTDKAYQYLARREHSKSELSRKLARFDQLGQSAELVNELVKLGHQSDARFAAQLGRMRVSAGKGPMALRHELEQHKIDASIIETVMAQFNDKWLQLAEAVRVKKFGEQSPTEYKEWARQSRFLQQRGFTPAQIPGFKCR